MAQTRRSLFTPRANLLAPGFANSRNLLLAVHSGAPAGTIQTVTPVVPAGRQYVVKAIRLDNSTSGNDYGVTLYQRRGADAVIGQRTVYRDSGVEFDTALVLTEGQSIGVQHSAPTNIMHTTVWYEDVPAGRLNNIVSDNIGPGTTRTIQNNDPNDAKRHNYTVLLVSDGGGPKWVRIRMSGRPVWQTFMGVNEVVTVAQIMVPGVDSMDIHYVSGTGSLFSATASYTSTLKELD